MIHYRPFLNCDPPAIADIWRSQPFLRGRMQNVTPDLLERFVFSKLYFDHDGLILACDDERPVGFAHAGFGPNSVLSGTSTETGVVSMLLVEPHGQRESIANELLQQSEMYLRGRGAKAIYAGGVENSCPFYLGFYGGSRLPGILASDTPARVLYESAGYVEVARHHILQRSLVGFRPPVSREQLQIRRRFRVVRSSDPQALNWWEASTFAAADRVSFTLISLTDKKPVGSAICWHITPLSDQWRERAAGLLDLQISADAGRQGLETYLMADAMQQLSNIRFSLLEVQTNADDDAAKDLWGRLGFAKIDEGVVLRKEL